MEQNQKPETKDWREQLFIIIFESDTPEGKAFDVALLWLILLSVFAVVLESVHGIEEVYQEILYGIEWIFTVIFTLEYFLRLICVQAAS